MVSPSFGSLSTSTNMSALADPTTTKGALSVMMMMMNDDPHQTNPRGEERRGEERRGWWRFFLPRWVVLLNCRRNPKSRGDGYAGQGCEREFARRKKERKETMNGWLCFYVAPGMAKLWKATTTGFQWIDMLGKWAKRKRGRKCEEGLSRGEHNSNAATSTGDCCWYQQKKGGEKRGGVVKSFFFPSLALCIQNKSSGGCCNYLRVPHTTVRGTAVAAELLQSEFNHKQEETRAKTV
jgi:hypothetical protein